MELWYEGVDITGDVQIVSAAGKDVAGGRSDSLELLLENAKDWYSWKPERDDRIRLVCDEYSTGEMYINAIAPEGDRFRILATAAKSAAGRKGYASFEGKTLEDIMGICAAECAMEWRLYGLDGRIAYPYLERNGCGCAAFLNDIAQWEGAVLKTYSGRFTMIGVAEAQRLMATETIRIDSNQAGFGYLRNEQERIRNLTVLTPYARVTATDEGAENGSEITVCTLPAKDTATAGRWAKGLLLGRNRRYEQMTLETEFRPRWTAMARIDVEGDTDANGKWMIDEVRHDFVNRTSKVTLVRCVETVK